MDGNNIASQVASRDQERVRGYQELLDFYQGKQWTGREKYGDKRLTFNYARVFIDKLTSYLMSGINFTVEAVEDTPEARARAEQAERALEQVYEDNNLEQLDFETEIDCAILGDGCYKVVYEGEGNRVEGRGALNPTPYSLNPGRVRVTAPDIQGIHAWWTGDDMARIWKVASKYELSAEEAERLYGQFGVGSMESGILSTTPLKSLLRTPNSQLLTVVEIWTDATFDLYLDNVLIESKPNPYGFIPFIIFPNLREPKKFWGISDLTQIMEPQRELNRALSQISHILELSGNPIAVLENVESSSDIAVRPGAVWNLPEDAKAYLLDLLQGGGLRLHIDYIDLLFRALHDISEAPRAAFGGMERDLSGVAMQIELYPILQKVLRKRAIRSSVYNRRNKMILKLLEKFGTPDSQLRTPYSELRMRTVWGQVLPQDKARLIENEQILVQNGVHSRRRAMDEVGVKDPEVEFKHWLEEQREIGANSKSQSPSTRK